MVRPTVDEDKDERTLLGPRIGRNKEVFDRRAKRPTFCGQCLSMHADMERLSERKQINPRDKIQYEIKKEEMEVAPTQIGHMQIARGAKKSRKADGGRRKGHKSWRHVRSRGKGLSSWPPQYKLIHRRGPSAKSCTLEAWESRPQNHSDHAAANSIRSPNKMIRLKSIGQLSQL